MSKAELERGMFLLLRQDRGGITELRFQPRFDLKVNGIKVGVYTADADYYDGDTYIVEDTKPPNFIDQYAKLKMSIFEAQYGIQIRIPQRKSGNMN